MNKSAIHKLLVLLLIIILPIFILKRHKILRDRSVFMSSLRIDQSTSFKDKHFAFIIPSSHSLSLQKSLEEIAKQNYDNYEIIFVDFNNKEETENLYLNTMTGKKQDPTFCSSYYEAIHHLKNSDIVIYLDIDNWLIDERVLEKLAYIFSNPDTWLVYCSYISLPSHKMKLEHSKQIGSLIKNHTYREEWLSSPVKIFYAGLFKELMLDTSQEDIAHMDLNIFLKSVAKKAKKHIHYIPEVLYYHDEKKR